MVMNPGSRLGPYEITGILGAGGMGEVYRARDTRLDRAVAIKVLPGALASDPMSRERFEREARTISALDHPNICALYDVGEQDGCAYLVMPCLEGETLASRIAGSALPLDLVLRIAIEICDALDRAHRCGIIHRDLKPGNIMLTKTGAKLLDFGLAKRSVVVAPGITPDVTMAGGSPPGRRGPLTSQGSILGTFHYMAPELLRGGEADARSDLYALGAVIYEMASGTRPFDAEDSATLIAAILEREPRALTAVAGLPARLDRAVRACLEKDPADRWQSARDLLRELKWIADESSQPAAAAVPAPAAAPPAARPRIPRRAWIAGAAVIALTALGGLAAWSRFGAVPAAPAAGTPVIVMMDSTHPARVYDPVTLKAGGTNADDLTDLLRDQPVELVKEASSTSWRREDQLLRENPSIFLVHRSCFYDATLLGEPALDEKYAKLIYPPAGDKLEVLLGYIALANPRTRFVVYSRGSWATEREKDAWVLSMTQRFPRLKGRLVAYKVPLDRATFRNPATGAEIKAIVMKQLADLAAEASARTQ